MSETLYEINGGRCLPCDADVQEIWIDRSSCGSGLIIKQDNGQERYDCIGLTEYMVDALVSALREYQNRR